MYKIGDQFVVLRGCCGFEQGQVITLNGSYKEGSGNAVFAGKNTAWSNAYDEHGQRMEGAWMQFKDVALVLPELELVKPVEPTPIEVKVDRYREAYMAGLAFSVKGLQDVCYTASKDAGWWTDLATGEAHDPIKLGPEKIALMHSELSEALEGLRKNQMDDKLPHRPMAEVELADCIIRALDWAGAMGYDVGGAIVEKIEFNANRPDHKIENRLKDDGKKF